MTRYVKMGNCIQCGQCCKKCVGIEPCLYYIDAKCSIYDDRPVFCRNFPPDWTRCPEGCGYYFIDTENNNKVMPKLDLINGGLLRVPTLSEEEKISWEIENNDPISDKAITFAKSWAALTQIELDKGSKLEDILLKTSLLVDNTGMNKLMYNFAVLYLAKFWQHGKELHDWYFLKGYDLIVLKQ